MTSKYRYPGPESFQDDDTDSHLFFGREREVAEVFNRLLANKLLVLYAKSGLGKTSLLQAGLFPLLRAHGYVPLRLRFNLRKDQFIDELRTAIKAQPTNASLTATLTSVTNGTASDLLVAVLKQAVLESCEQQAIDITEGEGDSFWEYFTSGLFSKGDRFLTPVLILDQFEEIFTLQNADYRLHLGRQLGYLATGQQPERVREQRLPSTAPQVLILISLREDAVGALQELAPQLPGILSQRLRLTELDRARARDAIIKPSTITDRWFMSMPFSYATHPDTATAMLDYLSGPTQGESVPEVSAHNIEPFQLQLLCRHIEQQVITHQATQKTITVDVDNYLGGRAGMAQVIKTFYQNALTALGWRSRLKARQLCEQGLLNPEGRRESLSKSQIERSYGLSPAVLNTLVDQKVLRREARLGSHAYELTHDSLANAVFELRAQQQKRRRIVSAAAIVVGVAFVVTGNIAIKQQNTTLQTAATSNLEAYQALVVAEVEKGNINEPKMLPIKAGTYNRGSAENEDEQPIRKVHINAFNMGAYEVTFAEYDQFAATVQGKLPDDNGWGRGKQPVINVSWDDATAYAQWLSEQTHKHYRLPTEAEWEYATRASSTSAFTWGDNISTDLANYDGNYSYNGSPKGAYLKRTLSVNSFKANAFGLFNVHGNVWEWVQDCYQKNYQQAPVDGTAFESANCAARVVRGGSWLNRPHDLRSAYRNWIDPSQRGSNLGFRLAQD